MSSRRKGYAALGAAATLASTAMLAGLAHAATAPAEVTLTGSTIVATAGSNVTFTANAVGITNPEYQFWVEMPDGKWVDAQNYSSSSAFVLKDVQSGNYLVAVDAMTSSEIAAGQWSQAVGSLADGVFVNASDVLSLSTSNPAPGSTVTATASATNIFDPLYQFWYETPDGVWHQSGAYSSANTFTIPAFTEQGAFKVVAYAKSPLAVNDGEGALISNVVDGNASLSTITASLTSTPTAETGITATFDQSGGASTSETLPVSDYHSSTNTVVFTPPSTLGAGTYTVTVVVEEGNGNFVTSTPVTYTAG